MRKVACGLQPSTTTARAGQANTGGIRGKVRSICGAKVGATDGNDGKHTKGGIDYDRRNLIRGGSVVGYRSRSQVGENMVLIRHPKLLSSSKDFI